MQRTATGDSAELVLPCDPAAVRRARAFVKHCCQAAGTVADARDTAVLLTSETVTNAFTHGHSEARLAVTAGVARVLVEVGDDNSRHPRPVGRDVAALDGRGLEILQVLSAAWGVRDQLCGKTVWFEVVAP